MQTILPSETQYGVIYSIDADTISNFARPPLNQRRKKIWKQTEKGESDYPDMFKKHEKWCACLDQEQFDAFIDHVCIKAEETETMGSIGVPTPDGDLCLLLLPAISFTNREVDSSLRDAYVTPFVPAIFEDWDAIRDVIREKYGE